QVPLMELEGPLPERQDLVKSLLEEIEKVSLVVLELQKAQVSKDLTKALLLRLPVPPDDFLQLYSTDDLLLREPLGDREALIIGIRDDLAIEELDVPFNSLPLNGEGPRLLVGGQVLEQVPESQGGNVALKAHRLSRGVAKYPQKSR